MHGVIPTGRTFYKLASNVTVLAITKLLQNSGTATEAQSLGEMRSVSVIDAAFYLDAKDVSGNRAFGLLNNTNGTIQYLFTIMA